MFASLFTPPLLTPARIRTAYVVAVIGDGLQMALGPLGWTWPDQVIDVILMIVMWRVLGFHPLLLPTFLLELFPLVDMLPTWVGCTALVITLRKSQQTQAEVKPAQVVSATTSTPASTPNEPPRLPPG